jgi:hypothetical protein
MRQRAARRPRPKGRSRAEPCARPRASRLARQCPAHRKPTLGSKARLAVLTRRRSPGAGCSSYAPADVANPERSSRSTWTGQSALFPDPARWRVLTQRGTALIPRRGTTWQRSVHAGQMQRRSQPSRPPAQRLQHLEQVNLGDACTRFHAVPTCPAQQPLGQASTRRADETRKPSAPTSIRVALGGPSSEDPVGALLPGERSWCPFRAGSGNSHTCLRVSRRWMRRSRHQTGCPTKPRPPTSSHHPGPRR